MPAPHLPTLTRGGRRGSTRNLLRGLTLTNLVDGRRGSGRSLLQGGLGSGWSLLRGRSLNALVDWSDSTEGTPGLKAAVGGLKRSVSGVRGSLSAMRDAVIGAKGSVGGLRASRGHPPLGNLDGNLYGDGEGRLLESRPTAASRAREGTEWSRNGHRMVEDSNGEQDRSCRGCEATLRRQDDHATHTDGPSVARQTVADAAVPLAGILAKAPVRFHIGESVFGKGKGEGGLDSRAVSTEGWGCPSTGKLRDRGDGTSPDPASTGGLGDRGDGTSPDLLVGRPQLLPALFLGVGTGEVGVTQVLHTLEELQQKPVARDKLLRQLDTVFTYAEWMRWRRMVRRATLTTYYLLLTTYYLLLTPYSLLLTPYSSLLTTDHLLLTTYYLPLTTDY